ncbi:hypothetical protein Bca4012_041558 [Brassica carinata]|uniref:Uncharacterized protein n=2 Tax=Brassica TaxID=3705 RepID=A0A0D3E2G8_BRAOL|nr:hypothetical protein Bca52824_060691 [Brassica carinata]
MPSRNSSTIPLCVSAMLPSSIIKWDYRRMKLTYEKLRGNKTSLLDHYYASWKGVCWGFMEEKMSHRYDEMIIPNKQVIFLLPSIIFICSVPSSV